MKKDPLLKSRSRALRREMTPAEKILWGRLRDRRFAGFKFRRQHVIGPYIVDFYCAQARLVLEIDGETHLGRERPDQTRQSWLEGQGLKVVRFWNTEVYDDGDPVMEIIWRECVARCGKADPSPPTPLPGEERGEDC
jgi:very-short-patch-repair endonuclease